MSKPPSVAHDGDTYPNIPSSPTPLSNASTSSVPNGSGSPSLPISEGNTSQENKSIPSERSDNSLSLVTGDPGDEKMSKSASTAGGDEASIIFVSSFTSLLSIVRRFLDAGRDVFRFVVFAVVVLLSAAVSVEKQNSVRLGTVSEETSVEELDCTVEAGVFPLREDELRGRFFLLIEDAAATVVGSVLV